MPASITAPFFRLRSASSSTFCNRSSNNAICLLNCSPRSLAIFSFVDAVSQSAKTWSFFSRSVESSWRSCSRDCWSSDSRWSRRWIRSRSLVRVETWGERLLEFGLALEPQVDQI